MRWKNVDDLWLVVDSYKGLDSKKIRSVMLNVNKQEVDEGRSAVQSSRQRGRLIGYLIFSAGSSC